MIATWVLTKHIWNEPGGFPAQLRGTPRYHWWHAALPLLLGISPVGTPCSLLTLMASSQMARVSWPKNQLLRALQSHQPGTEPWPPREHACADEGWGGGIGWEGHSAAAAPPMGSRGPSGRPLRSERSQAGAGWGSSSTASWPGKPPSREQAGHPPGQAWAETPCTTYPDSRARRCPERRLNRTSWP